MHAAYFIYCCSFLSPPLSLSVPLSAFHFDTSLCTNNLEPSPKPPPHLPPPTHTHTHQHYHCHQNTLFHLHCMQVPELIPHRGDAVHSLLLHVSLTLIGFKTRAYHHTYFLIFTLPILLFPQALPVMNYLFLNCSVLKIYETNDLKLKQKHSNFNEQNTKMCSVIILLYHHLRNIN